MNVVTGTLTVVGSSLYFEQRGQGPVLLLISGANGDAGAFTRLAEHLAERFTVISYDRRGFSRSQLTCPAGFDRRLQADINDAAALIQHIGGEPAIVFGASSGGVVALELLATRPHMVRTLIPFEPAAVTLLPDGENWMRFFEEVYCVYRTWGIAPAMELFRGRTFAPIDREVMSRIPVTDFSRQNANVWFEHELRQYPATTIDIEALRRRRERVILAVGRESSGYPCREVNEVFSRELVRPLVELPGGHTGFVSHPAQFAQELIAALDANSPLAASQHCRARAE